MSAEKTRSQRSSYAHEIPDKDKLKQPTVKGENNYAAWKDALTRALGPLEFHGIPLSQLLEKTHYEARKRKIEKIEQENEKKVAEFLLNVHIERMLDEKVASGQVQSAD